MRVETDQYCCHQCACLLQCCLECFQLLNTPSNLNCHLEDCENSNQPTLFIHHVLIMSPQVVAMMYCLFVHCQLLLACETAVYSVHVYVSLHTHLL